MTKIPAACFWQVDFWYRTSKHYLYRVVLYSRMTHMGGRVVCRTDINQYVLYPKRGTAVYPKKGTAA